MPRISMRLTILLLGASFAGPISASSQTHETNVAKPTVYVYPPPDDPDPGRDWDEYQPPKCKVVLQNSKFFPVHKFNNDDILRAVERPDCIGHYKRECLDEGKYPTSKERETCQRYYENFETDERSKSQRFRDSLREKKEWNRILLTERTFLDTVGNARHQFINDSIPTMTGIWNLSPTDAHIAFDNIVIMHASASTVDIVPKSTVITIAPTPAASQEEVRKHINALPMNQADSPLRMYNGTVCEPEQYKLIVNSTKCLTVFATLKPHHTLEDFVLWLTQFGWSGPSPQAKVKSAKSAATGFRHATNRTFDLNTVSTIDTPLLLKLAETSHWFDEGVVTERPTGQEISLYTVMSGVCAPNYPYWASQRNISRYDESYNLPVCFFSGLSPEEVYGVQKDSWKTFYNNLTESYDSCERHLLRGYAALVTYSWWADTASTPSSRALSVIAESDPRLENVTDCELENEYPELIAQPPVMLRPISGGFLAAPEIHEQPQPQEEREEPTDTPENPTSSSRQPPLPSNVVDVPPEKETSSREIVSGGVAQGMPGPTSLPSIQVGPQRLNPTYVGGSLPAVVIGTITVSRNGPVATINDIVVSLGSQGLVVGTKTIPIIPEASFALGTEQARVIKGSENQNLIILGSSTITAPGIQYPAAGHVLQFAADSVIVDGTSTYQFGVAISTPLAGMDGAIEEQQSESRTSAFRGVTGAAGALQTSDGMLIPSSAQGTAKSSSDPRKSVGIHNSGTSSPWRAVVVVGALLVIFL